MKIDRRFEELYQREFRSVFGAAFLMSGDRALAEDAAQEAFARALERWARLAGEPWVGGWVMRTALNVVRRSLRRRPPAVDRLGAQGDAEDRLDLWRGIRALPRRQQEAVVLRYVSDLTVAEVARAMRVSEGAVKTHLARARDALRRELEVTLDDR